MVGQWMTLRMKGWGVDSKANTSSSGWLLSFTHRRDVVAIVIVMWMTALLVTQADLYLPAKMLYLESRSGIPFVDFRHWVGRYMSEPLATVQQ